MLGELPLFVIELSTGTTVGLAWVSQTRGIPVMGLSTVCSDLPIFVFSLLVALDLENVRGFVLYFEFITLILLKHFILTIINLNFDCRKLSVFNVNKLAAKRRVPINPNLIKIEGL